MKSEFCALAIGCCVVFSGCNCGKCDKTATCDKADNKQVATQTVAAKPQDTSKCKKNLEAIGKSLVLFTIDHDDNFPVRPIEMSDEEYIPSAKLLACSITGKEFGYLGKYFQHTPLKNAKKFPVFFDIHPEAGIVHVLFADGHVTTINKNIKDAKELVELLNEKDAFTQDELSLLRKNAESIK